MQTFGKREIQTLNRNLKLQPKSGKTSKGNKIAQICAKTARLLSAYSLGPFHGDHFTPAQTFRTL
jgi:hypothetical protein